MQILKKALQSNYLIFCIFIVVIIFSYYRFNLEKNSLYKGNETEFKLEVIDKKYKDKYTITLLGKEKLVFYMDDFPYDVGDIIMVKGNLIKPKNNTVPNAFNYQRYLQSRGILWELNVNSIKLFKKNSNIINKIKKVIMDHINNNKYREYLYVYLLGDSSYFSKEKRNNYESLGLSYLISIGSLQVMMIVKLLKKVEGKFKIKKGKSLIINIVIIIFYIIFTNKIIGVLRSGLCYILSSILRYYKIKYNYQNIIYIIGIVLLLINPSLIINSGFLYSFTISIIISLYYKKRNISYFKRLFMISMIAFISSLPITIYFNYEINFLAVIYSFIFIPVFHFVIFPLSIIVFILSFLSPLYYFVISFVEYIINLLSKIQLLSFIFKKPSMIIIIIYYIVIICSLNSKRKRFLLILLLIIHNNINLLIKEKLITYLDVGEGDSIVIKNNNHLFLLDTGGNIYSNYSDNTMNYIKSLGFNKIEALILSHGDFDHMGEAINLVNSFRVEKVIFNCGLYSDLEKELIQELDAKKIKYYSCINKLDNLYFLKTRECDSENDNSSVIYKELNGYKFLFTGDASITTEKEIMSRYNLPDIDVLKVGHHGSRTSSSKEFINEINPKYSIISVGKNNRYGHPNKEVLNVLKDSKIYRTDQDGSIMFKIKNNKLSVETCNP